MIREFEFSAKKMGELMNTVDAETRIELMNNALNFFQWAVREVQSGRIIASIDETNKKYREVSSPLLNNARTK